MSNIQNPFPITDPDRYAIWQMLVERDIAAAVAQDWSIVVEDFLEASFASIDAGGLDNPDSWRISFPDVASYRVSWLQQARAMGDRVDPDTLLAGLHRCTTLRDIEINGVLAVAHKKFLGQIEARDGGHISLQWQTLYQCRKVDGQWKIAGFVGYMPFPMGGAPGQSNVPAKRSLPSLSGQDLARPYSPALIVQPGALVVISGQVALDEAGQIVGETIEAQARQTLENCRRQLNRAGCDLPDVFKANVFLTDMGNFARFNDVYRAFMPAPLPVRTTVEAGLAPGFIIEIEMWAVKNE